MALQLTKELDSGCSANYWKVSSVSLERSSDSALVSMELYKDAQARTDGKTPMALSSYKLAGFTITAMNAANPVLMAYDALKAMDEFSGSTDV